MGKSRWKGKRKMAFIKNIDHETVLNLADQIHAEPGQIVSKTLAQNKAVSLTLFAFSKGEEISTHDSTGDAMVHVIDGVGQFTVDGAEHICKAGDVLVMPAKKPHAVFAKEDFKMLLTVVFPLD
jgi:quercetin dioxygenase-like cupin family protein